jgi:hypothetical protein
MIKTLNKVYTEDLIEDLTVICEANSKEQSSLSSLAETFKNTAISDIT